jgi:hypothetical protein
MKPLNGKVSIGFSIDEDHRGITAGTKAIHDFEAEFSVFRRMTGTDVQDFFNFGLK